MAVAEKMTANRLSRMKYKLSGIKRGTKQRIRRYWEYGNPLVKRIAYIGWLNSRNLGDEMVFQAYQGLFPNYHLVRFVGLSHRKVMLYEKILRRDVFAAGFLAGGTMINKPIRIDQCRKMLEETPACYCLGTGVASPDFWQQKGDWEDNLGSWEDIRKRGGWKDVLPIWVGMLRQFGFVGVRGPLSAKYLRDAGLSTVEVAGDTGLFFARDSYPIPHEDRLLGVNIGTSLGNVWGTEEGIMEGMASLCRKLSSKGWRMLFFCVWPGDAETVRQLADEAQVKEPEIHEITVDIKQALDVCARCHVFIGMKLHSVVTSICAGIPSIMIEYRPKCRDFMASLGMEEFTVRSDSLDPAHMADMVEFLASNRPAIQERIRHGALEFKHRLIDRANMITGMIEENRNRTI